MTKPTRTHQPHGPRKPADVLARIEARVKRADARSMEIAAMIAENEKKRAPTPEVSK